MKIFCGVFRLCILLEISEKVLGLVNGEMLVSPQKVMELTKDVANRAR